MTEVMIIALGICATIIVVYAIKSDDSVTIDCTNDMHLFEPVYDIEKSQPIQFKVTTMDANEIEQLMNASKSFKKIYVKSICKYCGKEIHRIPMEEI